MLFVTPRQCLVHVHVIVTLLFINASLVIGKLSQLTTKKRLDLRTMGMTIKRLLEKNCRHVGL